jgi:hypothetical protein
MKIEVYVLVDADEQYWVSAVPFDAKAANCAHPTRLLSIVVDMPAPQATRLSAKVEADPAPAAIVCH